MKNKQRTMNSEQRTHSAFTLIELVVAVAILAIVFAFAGTIFRVSIDSYRTAAANGEIMQKLRAITDQLNSDFSGLQTDAPLLIRFERDPNDHSQRFDQILFFANGDFQSIQSYGSGPSAVPDPNGNDIVLGSVARIFYGQAQEGSNKDPDKQDAEDRILAKRQHILTDDTGLDKWPDPNDSGLADFDNGLNETYEHDRLSLAQWKLIKGTIFNSKVIPTCFDNRPVVDMNTPGTFHKLMCKGVGSFAIQWAYWDPSNELNWYPENTNFPTSDGVYFNIRGAGAIYNWAYGITVADHKYPKALKFTFRLYDSKGIIKEDGRAGREFTHIVYLND